MAIEFEANKNIVVYAAYVILGWGIVLFLIWLKPVSIAPFVMYIICICLYLRFSLLASLSTSSPYFLCCTIFFALFCLPMFTQYEPIHLFICFSVYLSHYILPLSFSQYVCVDFNKRDLHINMNLKFQIAKSRWRVQRAKIISLSLHHIPYIN